MKTRKDMAEYVRSFAINQFNKKFAYNKNFVQTENLERKNLLNHVKMIKESYQPYPHFKQKNKIPTDEFSIISNTLLEYGETLQISQSVINKLQESKMNNSLQDKEITKEIIDRKIQEKIKVDELMRNLSKFDDINKGYISSNVAGKIVSIQAQEVSKAIEEYTTLLINESEKSLSPLAHILTALEKKQHSLNSEVKNMNKIKEEFNHKFTEITEKLTYTRQKRKAIDKAYEKIKSKEFYNNKGALKKLKSLISVYDGLKSQESKFRDQCKLDLSTLNNMIKEVQDGKTKDEINNNDEYDNQKKNISQLRLQLAKKNRAIVSLIRQLDDIPGRFELTQYQRRFMELYNQVSVKHKETKQYYTLYNTLDDKKLYLSKELSLLNSIQDSYNEAMLSANKREQFIKQFESIIDGIRANREKIQKRCLEEKNRRDALSLQFISLMGQQRQYVAAIRQLIIECRKNETLLVQLRGL